MTHNFGNFREAADLGSLTAACLHDAWGLSNTPGRLAPVDAWVSLFRDVGFSVGGKLNDDARPEAPLTLYRGAPVEAARGMAWTPYRRSARAYVYMRGGVPVWEATVAPERLLAVIRDPSGREWAEVVIDPRGIDLRQLDYDTSEAPDWDNAEEAEDVAALAYVCQ